MAKDEEHGAPDDEIDAFIARTDELIAETDRQFEHLKSVIFASMALFEGRSCADLFPATSIWRFSRSEIVIPED